MYDKKCLIVESDPHVAIIVERAAQSAGFECRTAHNDVSFIAAHEHFEPDVLVMDVIMTGIDGFEIMQFLHGRKSKARIIIISPDTHARDRAVKLGDDLGLAIDVLLARPFRERALELMLKELKYSLTPPVSPRTYIKSFSY